MCFVFIKIGSKEEAKKEMATMAIINFDIPGDAKFPLNALYGKPQDRNEAGTCYKNPGLSRQIYYIP